MLRDNIDKLHQAVQERKKAPDNEDFTFTYEEEADPEVFFVPYVWEVVVCAVTSGSIEWHKDQILVFPLLEKEEEGNGIPLDNSAAVADPNNFSQNVDSMV